MQRILSLLLLIFFTSAAHAKDATLRDEIAEMEKKCESEDGDCDDDDIKHYIELMMELAAELENDAACAAYVACAARAKA